jgi:hypothetical protein
MTTPGPLTHVVHKALHRPLTWFGVERRLLIFAGIMGLVGFNAVGFLAGLTLFATLYGFSLWATRKDLELPRILLSWPLFYKRDDPGKRSGKRRPFEVR